jgi:surfactin synthase thioesterase subunit
MTDHSRSTLLALSVSTFPASFTPVTLLNRRLFQVLRQASFVRKMVDLGWTDPDFFADEEEMIVLQHCVARYHACV